MYGAELVGTSPHPLFTMIYTHQASLITSQMPPTRITEIPKTHITLQNSDAPTLLQTTNCSKTTACVIFVQNAIWRTPNGHRTLQI